MRHPFEKESPSEAFLEMAYFISPYPLRYITYMGGKESKNRQLCLRLRRAGYLDKEKLNTKPYVTIGKGAGREPFENATKWYKSNRKQYTHLPSAKKRNMNIRRADGLALAAIAMEGAGAVINPSHKPVFGLRAKETGRYYFHAREIKGASNLIGERQSRACGALINGHDLYHVFAEKKRAGTLPKAAEIKQWQISMRQAEEMFGRDVRVRGKRAIVLSELDSFPESVLKPGRIVSGYTMFEDLYFFNVRSEMDILRTFLDGGLDTPLFPEKMRKDSGGYLADYRIGSDFCFEFFRPNVTRLMKFLTSLKIHGKLLPGRGVIYCFDVQKDQIDAAVGNLAEIRTITWEEYLTCVSAYQKP